MAGKSTFDGAKIKRATQYAAFRNLGHAGAIVRKVASQSIRKGKKPSAVGTAPHTKQGALKKGILYAVEAGGKRVVIGSSAALVGPSGGAHEHGGEFRGDRYPKRPFMLPALLKVKSQIPSVWRSSIR